MARTTTNTNKTQAQAQGIKEHSTAFAMVGTLTGVYEGKKYNYIDIKVHPEGSQYYSTFTVTASPDIELFDDGTEVSVTGSINSFFDRQAQRTTYSFMVSELKAVSKS